MSRNKKCIIETNDYFSIAMLIFLALGLDVLVSILINFLIPIDIWYKQLISNFTNSVIWGFSLFLIYNYIRKNNLKNLFSKRIDKYILLKFIIFFMIMAYIIFSIKQRNILQFIFEFKTLKNEYKNYGTLVYIFQIIYYFLESMLITLIIVFGEKWGNLKFKKKLVPYGGIILSLSWGLIHIFVQDINTGIFAMIIAFILGLAFSICKKNIILIYILSLTIFLI